MILFISSAWLGGMDFELDRNLPSHGNSSSWKVSNLQKLKKTKSVPWTHAFLWLVSRLAEENTSLRQTAKGRAIAEIQNNP